MSKNVIPKNAVIPCPALQFKQRFASACAKCEHYCGIVDTKPKAIDGTPAAARYRIACGHPVARRFEVVDAGTE